MILIRKNNVYDGKGNAVIVIEKKLPTLNTLGLSKQETEYVEKQLEDEKKKLVILNRTGNFLFFLKTDKHELIHRTLENARKQGAEIFAVTEKEKIKSLSFVDLINNSYYVLAIAEGLVLSSYKFDKYKKEKTPLALTEIKLISKISNKEIDELTILCDAVFEARTLVNEPVSFLTAVQLSKEAQRIGKKAGIKTEVYNKAKIESLKMGGLLAVNRGSQDPPTFIVMEYKPAKAKNKKPIIFVGKGVVYDTGGLSLKPTPNSMDLMKSDMAGGAAVICAIYAIAKAELPYHVISIVPATDNRPGENAYTPGDVVKMYNGMNVEVLNTDAEGRMILGDALSYADKYKPELVIDLATLTGAAVAAVGPYGTVAMGTGNNKMDLLKQSGNNVYERLAEFPFWDEYDELIKSDIAEIKNIGGPYGGAITAGKFLAHFTNYPWIHLDIAGPSFISGKDAYRPKGGTGVGVRLLFDFVKKLAE